MKQEGYRCPFSFGKGCGNNGFPIKRKGGRYECKDGACIITTMANNQIAAQEETAQLNRTLKSLIKGGKIEVSISEQKK